ncbi:hypothetical protein [Thermodesulfitimonas autotrophica]|uniref:hypothetical protein n=1 Tax=Thermodesulfitimonas autotrophica TaxID=1894989 RepID=UPI002FDF0E35
MSLEVFSNLYRCKRLKDLHGLRLDPGLLRAIETLTEAADRRKTEFGMVLCRQRPLC